MFWSPEYGGRTSLAYNKPMITYLAREKNFSEDHSLAIRFIDEGLVSNRLKKFPIKETKIKSEYCGRCNAYHITREATTKV